MHHWLEVPAAGAAADLLAPLSLLLAFAVAYGLVYCLDGFLRGLFNALRAVSSWIPFAGSITDSVLHSAEQAISNALGSFLSSLEAHIATQFHALARYTERLWNYQVGVAENLWHLVQATEHFVTGGALTALGRRIDHAIAAALSHALTALEHSFKTEKVFVRSVAQGVYPRLRSLEHEVTREIPKEIRSARALAREAERGVASLWDAVRALGVPLSAAGISALIATAIAALGDFSFLKCSEWKSLSGKGCGIWGLLENAAGLLFDALIIGSICEVIPWLETGFSEIASPLIGTIAAAGAGLCNPNDAQAPTLAVPQLSTPPNPGFTLYVP